MPTVLAIAGSPSAVSRTTKVLDLVIRRLRAEPDTEVRTLSVRDLPPGPLLYGQRADPGIMAAVDAVALADGVVVATPIYQASYSGALKALLDVLPQFAFAGKVVLPLATGGSRAHVLAIDYALRPVLSALGADHVVPGYFVLDQWIHDRPDTGVGIEPQASAALDAVVVAFLDALGRRVPVLPPVAVPAPGAVGLG